MSEIVVIAADYPFLEILWTMLIFFALVSWIVVLFRIVGDIFRRHDISAWGKAGWLLFVIVLPLLGTLIYLIANGEEMARRDAGRAQAAKAEFDEYVRSAAADAGPAAEIEKARQLLDGGSITQAEYEVIKVKALG
jgi:Phospholipase_D-nuclease N-terminal